MDGDRRYSRRSSRRGIRAPGNAPSLDRLQSLARAARADGDPKAVKLIKAAVLTGDPALAWAAEQYLKRRAMEQFEHPDPFAPPVEAGAAAGELHCGTVKNSGCDFGLWRSELVQGTYVSGRMGSGKTTFIRRLLMQLVVLAQSVAAEARILVFDIKGDYVNLPARFPEVWVFRLPGPGFRWNPLEPPVHDAAEWAGIFAATFANSVGFYGGMSTENLLHEYLLRLYQKYDMAKGMYPCLLDLRDFLARVEASDKLPKWSERYKSYERICNRVEGLCRSLGETVNCSRGYPLGELLAHHVVLDMRRLKRDAQAFFAETFLTQSIYRRMEREERGGELRTLAVFDEGKMLMPKSREQEQHTVSNMSQAIAMGREFGIGYLVSECHASLLADSAKSAAFSRVCFSQSGGQDVKDSAAALGLADAEQAMALMTLRRGEAVVRLAERMDRPFVIEVTP